MKIIMASLACGLLLGWLSPLPKAFGTDCDDISNDHEADITCCGCTQKDWSDDRVSNIGATAAQIVAIGINSANAGVFRYLPSQVQTISASGNKLFSTGATRVTDCYENTAWSVKFELGSVNCDQTDILTFTEECGCS